MTERVRSMIGSGSVVLAWWPIAKGGCVGCLTLGDVKGRSIVMSDGKEMLFSRRLYMLEKR